MSHDQEPDRDWSILQFLYRDWSDCRRQLTVQSDWSILPPPGHVTLILTLDWSVLQPVVMGEGWGGREGVREGGWEE